ncbi:transmembrane protein 138 isoform X2 [Pseudomyrmex gracilis]|uniref:transmembrane protein 138 isoform X2 n=1 Tax=Pseudomyrmex gracilis TaxID=219809 RepID=UPI0009950456|nr:transmembrane protein 138 isoform X2 [Pseudomyrmex gracilis]
MNSLNTKQYTTIVILQNVLLLFDICVNSFASFARQHPSDMLILYVIQDFCLVIALTLLLISFFSTYIFQAGLIQLLYTKFRMTLVLCIVYMILSISLHVWHITVHWSVPLKYYWTKGFYALYSMQRTVLYYYFYKRASLRIADPRFDRGSAWIRKQLNIP